MSLLPVVIGADAHLFGIEAEYEFAFLSIKNKHRLDLWFPKSGSSRDAALRHSSCKVSAAGHSPCQAAQ